MSEGPGRTTGFLSFARRAIPAAVSAALLVHLARTIDLEAAMAHLAPATVLRFLLPLAVWNATTLAIEAVCLHRVTTAVGRPIGRLVAARIKSACYLLSLFHYAAGATALTFLLRRRMGSTLAEAASAVFVIALLDVGSVAGMAMLAGAFLPSVGTALRGGLLLGLLAATSAGFAFLRTPRSLGPLERLRGLEILRAVRTIPTASLAGLVVLRIVFVACYVGMVAGLFWAFGVEVPILGLALNVAVLLLVSALPIAVAGLGTAQVAFVTLFAGAASQAELLSMSILLSVALTLARALLGLAFARELGREAFALQSSMREERTRSSRDASRRRWSERPPET